MQVPGTPAAPLLRPPLYPRSVGQRPSQPFTPQRYRYEWKLTVQRVRTLSGRPMIFLGSTEDDEIGCQLVTTGTGV